MDNDPRAIAARLVEFVDGAGKVPRPPPFEHMRGGVQVAVSTPNPPPGYRPRAEVYELCIASLPPADAIKLAWILQAMLALLGTLGT